MISIGFIFTSKDCRVVCLKLEGQLVSLVEKQRILYPNDLKMPEFMSWCETQFELLIAKYRPERIGHKISNDVSTLNQVRYSCYPQAILNLIAGKRQLLIEAFSSQAINPTRLGLDKSENLFDHLDSVLGTHPPYWDKATREAALVAWFVLLSEK